MQGKKKILSGTKQNSAKRYDTLLSCCTLKNEKRRSESARLHTNVPITVSCSRINSKASFKNSRFLKGFPFVIFSLHDILRFAGKEAF